MKLCRLECRSTTVMTAFAVLDSWSHKNSVRESALECVMVQNINGNIHLTIVVNENLSDMARRIAQIPVALVNRIVYYLNCTPDEAARLVNSKITFLEKEDPVVAKVGS